MASSRIACWAAVVLFLAVLSTASPIISFPINSQVPPVARVGEPFSFVFSPSTFSSSSEITYSLSNPPGWLVIDGNSRRLFGTPGEADATAGSVTAVPLNLVATDDSGSTTLTATLVLSRNSGPKVEIPFDRQVPSFGTFSSPSAILSAPGFGFAFDLNPKTSSNPPNVSVSYYATMADNTPLPAWISFDPSSLSFSGQTPPSESLIEPPQHFSFQVIASDVVGFAGASLGFDIVVGNHQLSANDTKIVLNVTSRSSVSYTGLRSNVKVDGKAPTARTALIVSTPSMPSWLSVDNDTWHVTGNPPEMVEPTNFTITIRDVYLDVLNLTVAINTTGDGAALFIGHLPQFTIIPGQPFSFNLSLYLLDPRDTEISVQTDASAPWVLYNSSAITLYGTAPEDLKDSTINVKITAKSRTSGESEALPLALLVRSTPDGKGSTTASSSSASSSSDSADGQLSSVGDTGDGRFNPVLLAILLPLLLLLALGTCALFWYFRRRQGRQKPGLSTRDISGPLPGSFVSKGSGPGVSSALPDFTKRFGKSFSADDVFGADKNRYLEFRTMFLTKPDPPPPVVPARMLPPSGSPHSDPGIARDVARPTPVATSATAGTLRVGARRKISSSLSSITERSFGELVDSRGLESVGNDSRRSFRDKIEINVPRLPQTPGSTSYTGTPSFATEPLSTPRVGSSLTVPDTDAVPLRAESRFSYYPPAAAIRKVSWPWIKGIHGKRVGAKLVAGLKRLSEQPSVLTTDTSVSEKQQEDGQAEDLVPVPSSSVLPLEEYPSRVSLSQPPPLPTSTDSATADTPPKVDQAQEQQPEHSEEDCTTGPLPVTATTTTTNPQIPDTLTTSDISLSLSTPGFLFATSSGNGVHPTGDSTMSLSVYNDNDPATVDDQDPNHNPQPPPPPQQNLVHHPHDRRDDRRPVGRRDGRQREFLPAGAWRRHFQHGVQSQSQPEPGAE